ncbi:MAG: flagellin [Sinimarinibacterium flocculans]|uniref:Flagellin n=1 Tax=Sinimarinibacterium flocculans TaxID=985250 RepID=A0A318EFB8_9GAMM|nr:flagellin [Sinimarinibacterium flocculans]MEC9364981.1 flagellin [Pseudomonadota bacterium]PXV71487.1 flagellin [Sinimarinibacterium flocculans]
MQVINTNVMSLNAQRNLTTSQSSLATSLQRLSSGLRINSAKDDAAGLAISERFSSQIRGLDQAQRNANDGISLAQTAEGALAQVTNNLQRIRELAVQSANATNSSTDRTALQAEVDQLLSEIDRVANQTEFNGVKLLDGSFTSAVFQVGANAGETISVSSLVDANTAALSSVTSATGQSSVTSGISDLAAATAGDLVINGVDVSTGIGAAGSINQRVGQVVDAINNTSSQHGVSAAFDSVNGRIVLTSDADIAVTGNDDGTVTGFNVAGNDGDATAATTNGLTTLSVASFSGASLAIQQMDSALSQVNSARATLGAIQNRFESVVQSLSTTSENLSAARSRIQDTNFAAETANLTRAQILQQAGTAMLAQANSAPQNVLSLLQG